jgi:hypothetical protein
MALINRPKRAACEKILQVGFLQVESIQNTLYLGAMGQGLTPKEKAQLDGVKAILHEQGEVLKHMGWKIHRESQ